MKRMFALLLAVMMMFGVMLPSYASESNVIYTGEAEKFLFTPGSQESPTDLFSNFKNVMPGDVLEQRINIMNNDVDSSYIRVYLQLFPHGEDNPLIPSVQAQIGSDGRKTGDAVAYMEDFLKQLQMKIIDLRNNQLLLDGSANELGLLDEAYFLGSYEYGESGALKVELSVPLEMDSAYAKRIGEIDWNFIVERFDEPLSPEDPDRPGFPDDPESSDKEHSLTVRKVWDDSNSKSRPESVTVQLVRNGKIYDTVVLSNDNNWIYTWNDLQYKKGWSVKEASVLKGYSVSYEQKDSLFTVTNTAELAMTGQLNWPIPCLFTVGLFFIALGISLLWKGRKHA